VIRKHRALVVDDEVEAREELKAACSALGHEVVVASTVEEATARLGEHRFCYMVVDNVLPLREGMAPWARAGTNFLRDTRKRFSWKRLPVIVVTGRGAPEDVTAAFKAGTNDFALKPFDKAKDDPLDKKIREVLEFGCLSARACPHQGGDEDGPAASRLYTARHRVHFVGDIRKGRVLVEINDEPRWLQRNTFEVLWRLRFLDPRSRDGGWVHGRTVCPLQTNFSLVLGRVMKDLKDEAQLTDLVEWDKGRARVRVAISPDLMTHDAVAMGMAHKELLRELASA